MKAKLKMAEQNMQSDIDVAKRVLGIETEALQKLADGIDENFAKAIDIFDKTEGRVVITGMGKSGHIGSKIAATMASTGTPAFFVHPGEASHGDMGMITQQDSILALSNSGESSELFDILQYAKRFSVPLVAVTRDENSTLGKAADVVLKLPTMQEACPMRLAPTSSTTMSLAMGDAVAVALLERRGFSSSDFKVFHPGGKLGQQLLYVTDLMHSGEDMPRVSSNATIKDAVVEMSSKRGGCVGVLEEGTDKLLGMITDGDLRRHLSPDLLDKSVAEIMTKNPQTISGKIMAAEALAIMNQKSITSLFVEDNGVVSGIIHVKDFLAAGVA